MTQTGFTDSGWEVAGIITVGNPNTWEPVTVTVTDGVDGGGTCSVIGGRRLGGSEQLEGLRLHVRMRGAPTAPNGTNTATVAWDEDVASTPSTSTTATATAFTSPTTTVNKTVNVTDTFNGTTTTLGGHGDRRGTVHVEAVQYPRTVARRPRGAGYPNTAKIVETGQSAHRRCRSQMQTGA